MTSPGMAPTAPTRGRLIYLCSLGAPEYRHMTELCIRSLRCAGRYEGPIRVFTNNGFVTEDPRVEVVPAPHRLDTFGRFEFKARAARSIDGSRYEKVLFLDSDMLAIGDIEPLLGYRDRRICGRVEFPWTRMSDPACGGSFTHAEAKRAGRRWGINTGLLCTPGHLLRESTDLWLREIHRRRRRLVGWYDQPPFNALVLAGRIPFKAYPHHWIEMPPMYFWFGGRFRIRESTRILHFCWPHKRQSLEEMDVFFEATAPRRQHVPNRFAGPPLAGNPPAS